MSSKVKIAAATLTCWAGLVSGAWGQRAEISMVDLSLFQDGERWEFSSGDEILSAERRDALVLVTSVGAGHGNPVQHLTCSPGASWCAIRLEETEALTRIRLLKEDLDGREEIVFEAEGGQLRLVGAAASAARGPTEFRTRRSRSQRVADGAVAVDARVEFLLRCPEGDTWMHLSAREAAESSYFCQRHGHQLELAGGAQSERRGH